MLRRYGINLRVNEFFLNARKLNKFINIKMGSSCNSKCHNNDNEPEHLLTIPEIMDAKPGKVYDVKLITKI